MVNHEDYMDLAINLAKSAKGQTSPNPMVGAVVVKDGQVVGMGAHLKAGQPHAEVHAIRMAGEQAIGATIYVTLEPCSHFGKTPPCANLIIETGLSQVVIATTDPNPKVAGTGISRLQEAGIKVTVGVRKEQADQLNEIFFYNIQSGLPFVTLKTATSLDGKIATELGESKWITSKEAREDVHRYRHEHDAILVGVNTVLKDNPSLTTRLPNGGKSPIRVILDTNLKTPLHSNIIVDQKAPTWIIVGNQVTDSKIQEYMSQGVKILQLNEGKIKIPDLLKLLGDRGITSLFVEGGAEVNNSFVMSRLVNQIITYIAPKLIGGKNAPTSIGGTGFSKMDDVLELDIKSVETIGRDIKIIAGLKEGF